MAALATKAERDTASASALDKLVAATSTGMEQVNSLILERADSHVEMVPELARYLIDSGGKRLRPMLTLASAQIFGPDSGNQVKFAAAVEFMHTATLLHDDVVDESNMRRGKPAARKVWGNQASVLVGDFLLGQAFLMMVESRDLDALAVLSRAAAVIAEGEVFQLTKAQDLGTSAEEYFQVIEAKTATLFQAATEVGAMAGGADEAARTALSTYGMELGRAFQLVDDMLDYGGISGSLGKNTGDDLREGKMTLPVILALKSATPDEHRQIASALGKQDVSADSLGEIVAIMERHGALKATLEAAEKCAANARRALAPLPAGDIRDILAETADFCISRAY